MRKVTGDKVLERLEPFRGKGRVPKTSLSKDNEEALREATLGPTCAASRGAGSAGTRV